MEHKVFNNKLMKGKALRKHSLHEKNKTSKQQLLTQMELLNFIAHLPVGFSQYFTVIPINRNMFVISF